MSGPDGRVEHVRLRRQIEQSNLSVLAELCDPFVHDEDDVLLRLDLPAGVLPERGVGVAVAEFLS